MTHQQPTLLHPKYRPDIDGLRAIAVLAVVFFHAFPEVANGGFIGVDIFFVISGFLISSIIVASLQKNAFSFVEFYTRRIKRIFPALIVVMASCYLMGWFYLLADEFKQLNQHIASGASFIANIQLWREAGYFDNAGETKPLLHLWSLGVEEQFYILWPFMLWLAWRARFNLALLVALIAAGSFYLNIANLDKAANAFYLPQCRFWELLAGSLLAIYSLKYPQYVGKLRPGVAASASAVGLLLLALGMIVINKSNLFPGYWALIPTLGTLLVIFSGASALPNRIILSQRLLVWFGLISFPLYLWHWPLLVFARIVEGGTPSLALRAGTVVLAIVLAWLSFRWLEKPVRSSRLAWLPALLLALMASLGALGLYGYANDGLKFRAFHQQNDNSNAFDWPASKYKSAACTRKITIESSAYCRFAYSEQPSIALIGDSHANAIFDFFDLYFSAKQKAALVLGSSGCPPLLKVERGNNHCATTMDAIANYINSNNEITQVFITARFAATESGSNLGGEPFQDQYRLTLTDQPEQHDRQAIFKQGLENTIRVFMAHQKHITVLLDVPELSFDPKSCLGARTKTACAMEANGVYARQAAYTQIIRQLQQKYEFKVIDLKDALCTGGQCIAKYQGKILYRDSHHLGIEGSRFLFEQGVKLD